MKKLSIFVIMIVALGMLGVNLPQALSNMCTYISGISRNLDISEVVNNNLAAEGDTAVIAGRVS